MERLILAIIAVICLHIAYIAYIYTDRPIETARQPAQSGTQPRSLTGLDETFARLFPQGDIQSTLDDIDPGDTAAVDAKAAVRRRSGSNTVVPTARRLQRYSPPVDRDDVSDRGPFKSVTIEIPRPYIPKMPVEPEPPAIKASLQRTENKSFMSNVLPVIKKPYTWLKALGSKLK